MMEDQMKPIIAALVVGLFCSFTFAQDQDATLKIGAPAPALAGGKWIKGEPVNSFEPGKIYVVEFWATWCGPCKEAIPHVTEMQKKYAKDNVIFIGQDVWERKEGLAEPFVKEMGDKMEYRVVLDTNIGQAGTMAKTWMEAAGQNSIPCSFLIDKAGKVAWIGHPMELEPVLQKVIAGNFDAKKQAAEQNAMNEFNRKFMQAMRANNTDEALKMLDEQEQKTPEIAGKLAMTRFQVLLLKKKDYDAAYKAGAKAVDAMKDNAQALNQIAWTIVDGKGIEKRDLDLAMRAANQANELTKGKDGAIMDTLAHVHFMKGDVDKAVDVETAAVANANADMKDDLEKNLAKFKKAQQDKAR